VKARVREATEADLPRIVELLAQLDAGDPGREDMRSPLPYDYHLAFRRIDATPGLCVLVIESGKRLAGTLALVIVPNLSHRGAPFAIIENVVVDESKRSQGYGEALIREAVERARKAGCYKVSLTSNKSRQEAHRFYARLGFQASHEGFRVTL
jgi:ribosomal protein S18 acetylase RimI-like enzyme